MTLQLQRERNAMRDLLEYLEWSGEGWTCPFCKKGRFTLEGHAVDCYLAALIGKSGEAKYQETVDNILFNSPNDVQPDQRRTQEARKLLSLVPKK